MGKSPVNDYAVQSRFSAIDSLAAPMKSLGSVRIFVFEARGAGLIHAVVRLWLTCWPFKAKGTLSRMVKKSIRANFQIKTAPLIATGADPAPTGSTKS